MLCNVQVHASGPCLLRQQTVDGTVADEMRGKREAGTTVEIASSYVCKKVLDATDVDCISRAETNVEGMQRDCLQVDGVAAADCSRLC
jgi:hypothetical protein